MAVEIRFTDNSSAVLSRVSGNVRAALTAMGVKGVGLTVDQMQSGYGRPIRQTGTLMGDVSYEVERSGSSFRSAKSTRVTFDECGRAFADVQNINSKLILISDGFLPAAYPRSNNITLW